ncbi:ankyrin repeat-containing domain protein [Mycena pura]|uniref:Ankyrin repeat-containing domain protein n=1 Tax=Mycena pura TaxID=153505 RepID=A0AAD6YIP8_9AGAR|nr:ankyrin repeat-containing domain protein [Mycena pura]
MSDFFNQLPPELMGLLPQHLSWGSLNSLTRTCRRLHAILQPALDALITPAVGKTLLLAAAPDKPHIVAKLLAPPYRIPASAGYESLDDTPLHAATAAGNRASAALLLAAGADPSAVVDEEAMQALHIAALRADTAMAALLLEHGAPVDVCFGHDGAHASALHLACATGNIPLVELLLARGADMGQNGHNGPALGFAVQGRQRAVVQLLLERGANAIMGALFFARFCGIPGDQDDLLLSIQREITRTQDEDLQEIGRLLTNAVSRMVA